VDQFDKQPRTHAEVWHTKAVAELLAASPLLKVSGVALKANLRACIEYVAEGNLLAFAEVVQLSRPGLDYLTNGKGLPELGTLLQICHQADTALATFLTSLPVADAGTWDRLKQTLQSSRKDCRVPLSRSREQVRAAMRAALHEQPPPSLSEIARRLDYKGVEGLRDVDKALSKQLAANYRKSGRTHWWRKAGAARICEPADIRAILEQSLSEKNPRPLYQLAVNLGYVNEGYIQNKFPMLCSSIRQKIKKNNEARISTMEHALRNALKHEHPPSLDELRRRLGFSCSTVLKNHFPLLYEEVLTRRRLYRGQNTLELTKALQSALSDVPAPSLVNLCMTLNTPEHILEKLCPRECASIRARYRHARADTSVRRKEQLQQEVRQIIRDMQGEGTYPTIKQVRTMLSQRGSWAEVSTAVATVRKEFRTIMWTSDYPTPERQLQSDDQPG
jgi:DNA-binding phage protein